MYFSFIGIVVVNDIKIGMPKKKMNLKKSVEKKSMVEMDNFSHPYQIAQWACMQQRKIF